MDPNKNRFIGDVPLFCVDSRKNLLVFGGGGGSLESKTGLSNKISIFNIEEETSEWKEVATDDSFSDCVKCVAFHPEKDLVTFGVGKDCKIAKFEEKRIDVISTFETDTVEQKTVKWSKSGDRLFTGGNDGKLSVWKYPSQEELKSFREEACKDPIDDLDIHPSEQLAVAVTQSGCFLCDLTENKTIKLKLETKSDKEKIIFRGARFSSDGNFLYVGKILPKKRSWIISLKKESNTNWVIHKTIIAHRNCHHNFLDISSDGQYLATGTSEGKVTVFALPNLRKIGEYAAHNFIITSIRFTPNNQIASVSADYSCVLTTPKPQRGIAMKSLMVFIVLLIIFLLFFYITDTPLPINARDL